MTSSKKPSLQVMMSYMTQEDRDAIKEGREQTIADALAGFDNMDLNDDGLVERADLIQMAKQAIDLSDEDVDSSFSSFDLKQQGNISR